MKAPELIDRWLSARLKPEALAWIRDQAALFSKGAAGASEKLIFHAFSAAVRHSGKGPLDLSAEDLAAAGQAVEGWDPSDWTLDIAARIRLLIALPAGHARTILSLYQTADVAEAVALQKALPLLPEPEAHMHWAREGIRSNIKLVYEAITLRNPYPARHFDETGWNQMTTKTFFMESPLEAVWGLDARANPALGQILVDLAFERWAAGRTFSPQLWRCVGPVADKVPRGLAALEQALSGKAYASTPGQLGSGSDPVTPQHAAAPLAQRRAAALALSACKSPEAARLLAQAPDLAAAAKSGALSWETLNA